MKTTNLETAVFGGGCFWCTEAVFQRVKGVITVMPGYAGGAIENPSYYEVSSGDSGHAEVIKIEFDPIVVSYRDLLEVFFAVHDPTTLNRQGNDTGTQYRSIILYTSAEQKVAAERILEELVRDHIYTNPIVTELTPLVQFYMAEKEHVNYYNENKNRNPYCSVIIDPKLKKFKDKFKSLQKDSE